MVEIRRDENSGDKDKNSWASWLYTFPLKICNKSKSVIKRLFPNRWVFVALSLFVLLLPLSYLLIGIDSTLKHETLSITRKGGGHLSPSGDINVSLPSHLMYDSNFNRVIKYNGSINASSKEFEDYIMGSKNLTWLVPQSITCKSEGKIFTEGDDVICDLTPFLPLFKRHRARLTYTVYKDNFLFSMDSVNVIKSLMKGNMSDELRDKFKSKHRPLSKSATLKDTDEGKWIINDGEKIYFMMEEISGTLEIYESISYFTYVEFRTSVNISYCKHTVDSTKHCEGRTKVGDEYLYTFPLTLSNPGSQTLEISFKLYALYTYGSEHREAEPYEYLHYASDTYYVHSKDEINRRENERRYQFIIVLFALFGIFPAVFYLQKLYRDEK